MKTNFLINTKVFIQNMKSGKSVDGGFSGAVLEFGPFTPIERAIIDASNLTLDSMGINNPITGNIILPKEGPNGTVISWEFTPADYIDDTGKVTLPLISSYLEGGKVSVIMKATVTKGTEMETAQIKTFQVDVLQREPIELITEILPDAKVGETFNYTFEAIGGYDVYEYSFGDAPLEGFSIDPTTGILSGTPLTAGVYPFNIKVTDKDNNETGLLPEEKESKGTFTLTVYE
jgi:hypothetical protein